MSNINWQEILGWNEETLDELRLTGFSMLREGKYDKALLFFHTLAILNPKSIYDQQTLGALYLQLGEKEKALAALNYALTLDPENEPTLLNKMKTLLLLGKKEEAFTLARRLQNSLNAHIANDTAALVTTYS